MAENEIIVLSDKSVIPTDEYIFSLIGERKVHWQKIVKFAADNYEDVSGSWNYYNDGKQWLFKLVRKKKTVFWASIVTDAFRVTFYFGDKAQSLITGSDLPERIKEEFKTAKRYGAIRPITITVFEHSDVENVLKLIVIKNKIK